MVETTDIVIPTLFSFTLVEALTSWYPEDVTVGKVEHKIRQSGHALIEV